MIQERRTRQTDVRPAVEPATGTASQQGRSATVDTGSSLLVQLLNRKITRRVLGRTAAGVAAGGALVACSSPSLEKPRFTSGSASPDASHSPSASATPKPEGSADNQKAGLNLRKFDNEAEGQQWAVSNLAGDEKWLQDPTHWHLTKDGGLVFDIPSNSYGREHVNLSMKDVKDQVMVQGYRNIWNGDSGTDVTRDAYVVVGEDSFHFRQATVWVYDHKLTPQELSQAGNEGYKGQVQLEATEPDQKNVDIHAVGFNPDGFIACETVDASNPTSRLNIPQIPSSIAEQQKALQAFATLVGTDAYTKDASHYRFVQYGGIKLIEDSRPGVHHRVDLSMFENNAVVQGYQDVKIDGNPVNGWMRDAFAWVKDGTDGTPNNDNVFVRGATFWISKDQMTAGDRQYNGQVAYVQQVNLEATEPDQKNVKTHLFGAPKPTAPTC